MYTDNSHDLAIKIPYKDIQVHFLITKNTSAVQLAVLRGNYELASWMCSLLSRSARFVLLRGHRDLLEQSLLDFLIIKNDERSY